MHRLGASQNHTKADGAGTLAFQRCRRDASQTLPTKVCVDTFVLRGRGKNESYEYPKKDRGANEEHQPPRDLWTVCPQPTSLRAGQSAGIEQSHGFILSSEAGAAHVGKQLLLRHVARGPRGHVEAPAQATALSHRKQELRTKSQPSFDNDCL